MDSVTCCGFLASHIPTNPWPYGMPQSVPWQLGGHNIITIIVILEGLGLGWSLQPHQIFWPRPIPTSKKIYTEGYVDVGPISLKCAGREEPWVSTLVLVRVSGKDTSMCDREWGGRSLIASNVDLCVREYTS